MKIIFAGTPNFAKEILVTLNKHHEIVGVFCQPDRPKGRGKVLTTCPVKTYAIKHNMTVFQPEKMGNEEQQQIQTLNAQIMVVVAFGQILPKVILDTLPKGCVNIHASLLPRWRGASPIQSAILAGDKQTGVCVMQMDKTLDTGDILLQKICAIDKTDTAQTLHDKLIRLGQLAIIETLKNIDHIRPRVQRTDGVCYAHKLHKQTAWIDWQQSAQQIHQQIRAFNPYPIAQTQVNINGKKQVLRIIQASIIAQTTQHINTGKILKQSKHQLHISTSLGILVLEIVQLQGKKAISVHDFNNAYSISGI